VTVTKRGWLGFIFLIGFLALAGLAWMRAEGDAPQIAGPEALVVGGEGRDLEFSLTDGGMGLREFRATLRHAGGEDLLREELFAGDLVAGAGAAGVARQVALRIDPKALDLADGDAFLHVEVRDWSWRNRFQGNVSEREIPVSVDRKKPRVQVFTGLTYIQRGGAGIVAYSVSEPSTRDGVAVGDAFYRGYPHPEAPDRRIALYAVPTDAPPKPAIRIEAEDAAGNIGTGRWSVVVRERLLPEASVTLPESFLEQTVRDLAEASDIDTADLHAAFRIINSEMRSRNEEQIRNATADSTTAPQWHGSFVQLANSKVTSRFAERRTYFVGGTKNSEAVHFGYDLASTSLAPITAANDGRVVYADDLGIYGNCVLIDHGLGLATLYGHLSQIDVSVGDAVAKGDTLGLSGATGLAGGDHLHFAILVGGTYVDPLEWWDRTWIRTHIDTHLAPSSG
jgi:murein DD-endopeptidase MepM/ murein hydrolase activator NlpD